MPICNSATIKRDSLVGSCRFIPGASTRIPRPAGPGLVVMKSDLRGAGSPIFS